MTASALPKGISQLANGSFRLTTAAARGSTRSLIRDYVTLKDAVAAKAIAQAARAAGREVASALDANAIAPALPLPVPRAAVPVACRTLRELYTEEMAERQKLVEVSDPTFRRNVKKGRSSLRLTTLKSQRNRFESRILPYLGDKRLDELDRSTIHNWLVQLAQRRIHASTAAGDLRQLRFMIKHARKSERPEDFPWKGVDAIPPKNPRLAPDDPSKWGGLPGDNVPLLTFAKGQQLAACLPAADRIVLYFEHFGGPRIGETFGLRLGDFEWRRNYLWVTILRQMLPDGEVVDWVKSDAGYRRIPLAPILADYVCEYAKLYHDYDLKNPDPSRADTPLVVNPAGRDVDGSFLPGKRSNFAGRFTNRRDANGFDRGTEGHGIHSHTHRKACATYLLHAKPIIHEIKRQTLGDKPGEDDPHALIAWYERKEAFAATELAFEPMDVSRYLGHEYNSRGDQSAASIVTLTHYNLSVESDAPFEAIASAIDLIARHEIGSLVADADDWDRLPVHFSNDPDWVTSQQAAQLLGISHSNVTAGVRNARLEGHTAWPADGGYKRNRNSETRKPSLPIMVVSRRSIDTELEMQRRPCVKTVEQRLGMSNKAVVANFVVPGVIHPERYGDRLVVDPAQLDALVTRIHDAVLTTLHRNGPTTRAGLRARFNEQHGAIFQQQRALPGWFDHWVDDLIAQKKIRRHLNGTIAAVTIPASPAP